MLKLFTMRPLLFFIAILISQFTFSQNFSLSQSSQKRAEKKASAEAAMYIKKGFVTKDGSDLKNNLLEFYKTAYRADENKVPEYIWGMGTRKGSNEEEAQALALKDAIEAVPGLIETYFQMWTMASDASQEEKDKISSAIGKVSPAINEVCLNAPHKITTYLVNSNGKKIQVHIRTLTNQLEVRSMARKEIMKELKKTTDWDEVKMMRLLTFDK